MRLFGSASIVRTGRPLTRLPLKSLELLCYLIIHAGRGHDRESLARALWPDEDPVIGKRHLRQALWRLNAAVEADLLHSDEDGRLQLDPDAFTWIDVQEFGRTSAATRDLPGPELSEVGAKEIEQALDLYRDDLLAGWQQEWCLLERARYEQAHFTMLEQLMAFCEVRGDYVKGIALGRLALERDPIREATHRRLMRLHYGSGDRGAAVRQFQTCVSVLQNEFEISPSPQTVALYRQIRTADDAWVTAVSLRAEPSVSERLDEIQASLRELLRLTDGGNSLR